MGLSLKGITKGIGKVATNVGKAVKKGASDVGHAAGDALSNPLVQGAIAVGTGGLSLPAQAGIMAATKGAGALMRPGGNLGKAVQGAASGATGALPGVGDVLQSQLPGVIDMLGGGKIPLPSIPGLPGGISIPGLGHVDLGSVAKTLGNVLPLVAGAKDLSDANGAASARNTLMGRMTGIADDQAAQGRSLMQGQAPIRQAAEAQLLQRLKSPPSFIDTANPFASRFPAPPASMTGGAPTAAPALPPPTAAPTVQGQPQLPGRLRRAAGVMS